MSGAGSVHCVIPGAPEPASRTPQSTDQSEARQTAIEEAEMVKLVKRAALKLWEEAEGNAARLEQNFLVFLHSAFLSEVRKETSIRKDFSEALRHKPQGKWLDPTFLKPHAKRLQQEARNAADFTEQFWMTSEVMCEDVANLRGKAVFWVGKTASLQRPSLFVALEGGDVKMFWFEDLEEAEFSLDEDRLRVKFRSGVLTLSAPIGKDREMFETLTHFCQTIAGPHRCQMKEINFHRFRIFPTFNHIPAPVQQALNSLASRSPTSPGVRGSHLGVKRVALDDEDDMAAKRQKRYYPECEQQQPKEEDVEVLLVHAKEEIPERDPLTQERLTVERIHGVAHPPLQLECGHVYNYSTVFGTKSNGAWLIPICAVAACRSRMPINRSRVKLCPLSDTNAGVTNSKVEVIEIL